MYLYVAVFSPTDTIVAIATAPVRAGIGVVRISGPRAHGMARAILTAPHDFVPRYATLTRVRDFEPRVPSPEPQISEAPERTSGRPIDEVVATYFPAPPAFAGGDSLPASARLRRVVV